MGVGWLAIIAARAAQAGESIEAILALIEELKPRVNVFAGLETLEWAARSGRIHRVAAALGNLLAVKPILKVYNGEVGLAERVRTHNRQVERVIEMAVAQAPWREVAVMHARAPAVAEEVAGRLASMHPRQRIIVGEIGCALGSYTGPGAYGIITVSE
jgi:DegV family protein with EDD domain